MNIPFSKYSGCGNDFVMIDNRSHIFPIHLDSIIHLCHRQKGIGADGIILLENSEKADLKMRIFNADGSEAEMCGNGIRCLLGFAQELGIEKTSCRIETMERILKVSLAKKNEVCVEMGQPTNIRWDLPIASTSYHGQAHFLNTGVPHLVLFFDRIDDIDVYSLGKELRNHSAFSPQGTNVNFAAVKNDIVHIRTYERGVENETLACGTGATACGLAAAKKYQLTTPVHVKTLFGDILKIGFDPIASELADVTLTGPFTQIFKGSFSFPCNKNC